jgi:hypothetical protein
MLAPGASAADPELPPLLGPVRRGRLLGRDPQTATWEGWDTHSATRVLLRTLSGPAAEARLRAEASLSSRSPALLRWRFETGARVWLRSEAILGCLADRAPLDPEEAGALARPVAAAGVAGLGALHAAGGAHGHVDARALVQVERAGGVRWALAWWGIATGTPRVDWQRLGALVGGLGEALDVETFEDWPPVDAADARDRVRVAGASELACARHLLARRARACARELARARVRDLAARLQRAVPPPRVHGTLRSRDGRSFTLASADGDVFVSDGRERAQIAEAGRLRVPEARALIRAVGRSGGESSEDVRGLVRWVVQTLGLSSDLGVLASAP